MDRAARIQALNDQLQAATAKALTILEPSKGEVRASASEEKRGRVLKNNIQPRE